MTLDPTLAQFIASGALIWLVGYGVGITWRFVRQVFEKASRGG